MNEAEKLWSRVARRVEVCCGLTSALDFMMDSVDEQIITGNWAAVKSFIKAFEPDDFPPAISLGLLTILHSSKSRLDADYTALRELIYDSFRRRFDKVYANRMLKGL